MASIDRSDFAETKASDVVPITTIASSVSEAVTVASSAIDLDVIDNNNNSVNIPEAQ